MRGLVVVNALLTLGILVALGYRRLAAKSPPPPLFHLLNCIYGLLRPDWHTGRPTPAPRLAAQMRYPPTDPPPNTANLHGEIEVLTDGTEATHWYAAAAGVTWHFVTAGDPDHETVLMLHGLPESWWAFHHQISDLSKDHYVVALDCKGYGQSDKRVDLDYRAATMAVETAALLDELGVDRFHNNFDIEHRDRHESLFAHMTMPVLILQGRWDPGQHPEEYARSSEFAADLRVEFVEANHFTHIENPVACNRAIRRFLGSV